MVYPYLIIVTLFLQGLQWIKNDSRCQQSLMLTRVFVPRVMSTGTAWGIRLGSVSVRVYAAGCGYERAVRRRAHRAETHAGNIDARIYTASSLIDEIIIDCSE